MSEIPDIIKCKIVENNYDVFWNNATELENLKQKNVLVITQPFEKGSQEEVQLIKMLGACNLTEVDYEVLQMKQDSCIAWHKIREQVKPSIILVLGIELERLAVSAYLMPHQVSRFDERSWIVTLSLTELIHQQDIKTHLWKYGLKPVFVDKIYG